jgi:hypothetical protein
MTAGRFADSRTQFIERFRLREYGFAQGAGCEAPFRSFLNQKDQFTRDLRADSASKLHRISIISFLLVPKPQWREVEYPLVRTQLPELVQVANYPPY